MIITKANFSELEKGDLNKGLFLVYSDAISSEKKFLYTPDPWDLICDNYMHHEMLPLQQSRAFFVMINGEPVNPMSYSTLAEVINLIKIFKLNHQMGL